MTNPWCGLALLMAMLISASPVQSAEALTGYEAFAHDPAISAASVSPDGRSLGTLQRFAKDGKQFLLVYDIADMDAPPVTLGAETMDIVSFFWANNDRLVVRFRQDVDTLEELGANTRLASKLASIDRQGKRWLEIPRKRADRRSEMARTIENFSGASIFSELPRDEKHILISYDDDQNGVSDIFKVDIRKGSAKRVARNSSRINITYIDEDGQPRLAERFDEGDEAIIYYGRLKGKKDWIEIGRQVAGSNAASRTFEPLRLVGAADSNRFYVLSNHDTDTVAVYIYDLEKRAFEELQFMHPRYDATGVRATLDDDRNDKIIGFTYTGKAVDVYLIDPEERARYEAIDQVLPDTRNTIVSRSDNAETLVIRAVGPRNPTTYYLLHENELNLLGKSRPFLSPEMLSDVEWVTYKARDGMEIPAYVTIPAGKPPFPAVVMPHGGPTARDYWGYDNWAQMIAHHGYLVIQPQFRMSTGFGREHLEAGFGQMGMAMQDDLDDALTYLESRKLIDPSRTAIFGWSYGGYAAMMGSLRDPNPYRCAIAGAGVADVPMWRASIADSGTFVDKTYRSAIDGISPLEHVDSVDIPILLIHGDIDERVSVEESRKFVRKLKQFNKQYEYLELEGANHFFGTIYYRHYMKMFPAMIDWLDNTCGLAKAD